MAEVVEEAYYQPPIFKTQEMEDDKLLLLVERVLANGPKSSITEALHMDAANGKHEHEGVQDDDMCYVLSSERQTYYMCSKLPDNDNLICEQQADGMDWICRADWSA